MLRIAHIIGHMIGHTIAFLAAPFVWLYFHIWYRKLYWKTRWTVFRMKRAGLPKEAITQYLQDCIAIVKTTLHNSEKKGDV